MLASVLVQQSDLFPAVTGTSLSLVFDDGLLVNAEEEFRGIQFTMPQAFCSTSHVSGHDLSVLPEMNVANREGGEVAALSA
jgi:hypothetical protein